MDQIILKSLGKRKVKSILNQWIKDQINRALEDENIYNIAFDYVIWLDEYEKSLENTGIEPIDSDIVFKFVGNKI